MAEIRTAAVVAFSTAALVAGGLLTAGTATAAGHHSALRSDIAYTFQNVATDLNLDGFGTNDLKVWNPDASGTQDFYMLPGRFPGYQLKNKSKNLCATAKENGAVVLENCNSAVKAQYWEFDNVSTGSPFSSAKYPNKCITDTRGVSQAPVTLAVCNNTDNQKWQPLIG